MNVQTKGNELITKLLNDWYQAMLQQQVLKATNLKQEIDEKIANIKEDKNLLFYHSLLDFRYKVLTDGLSITKESFNMVGLYNIPSDNVLSYYYHFFKAIHATLTTNYNDASEHFEKAEKLLKHISDELEHAEFYYRLAIFNQHFYKPVEAIQFITKAKEIFVKYSGYEIKVGLCDNTLGAACVFLKQYEQAEEKYNSAINILQKFNENDLILSIRNNLGWLYASQNLSILALRHLSEVTAKKPTHFKAIFLQAREHHKLGDTNIAKEFIEKGLKICNEIGNTEYTHHFTILQVLNNNAPTDELEKIFHEGITYFKKESLYNYTQEYAEKLAVKFYEEDNLIRASKYFYIGLQAKEKTFEKGALK
ncbi:Rap family tetratricopeptide repeat protein [Bacillus sp. BP-3]|uniref:Rap family tetratricopeptide repeat protein n=1 Tax=Bacillus sp. BP-3 TaxID=3022773 RepID=UPI00232D4C2C|nr:Rap family tetratricopeptide repeat protein [Bacillus sp. BP-3]MDC2867716.1 tetratricopeptide repeat protein [Bacillus sp. BP-3]